MTKRILGAVVALVLGLGAALAVALPASAHTGDLHVTAVCNPVTGQYDLTATLTTSNTSGKVGTTYWDIDADTTGAHFSGTPNSGTVLTKGPVSSTGDTTVTLGVFSLPGTTTGKGPWVYGFTTWAGADKGSDGQLLTALDGKCSKPNFIETSHVQYCGGVDITLRNVSPWIYPVTVTQTIGGVASNSYGPTVDNRTGGGLNGPQKDQSATRTITYPEDFNGGSVAVSYVVNAGSENKLYVGKPVGTPTNLVIITDCQGTVDASATFVQEVCTGPGTKTVNAVTLTGDAGVTFTYTKDGVPQGSLPLGTTSPLGFGHIVVTALPPAGSLFPGNVASKVVLDETFVDAGDCLVVSTPVIPDAKGPQGCTLSGTVTEVPVTGVVYATTFDKKTGAWETIATPAPGYKFVGPQIVKFSGNVGAPYACTTTNELAATGINRGAAIGLVVAIVIIVIGLAGFFTARSIRKRDEKRNS